MTIPEDAAAVPEDGAAFEPTHRVLFYDNPGDYTHGVASFLHEGLIVDEPALVAVPSASLDLVRTSLDGASGQITFLDMMDVGRNPARLIPAVRDFIDTHPGRRTRAVGECVWPGRSPAETREAIRHESLSNLAFAGVPASFLCPYNLRALDAAVLRDAVRTHPRIRRRGQDMSSPHYTGSALARTISERPPPAPPADAGTLTFGQSDLPRLRRLVRQQAARTGLARDRAEDLVMAVNELAANTLLHAGVAGTLHIWQDHGTGALICEVRGPGRITDPLAGARPPAAPLSQGAGLWLVNQVCDLTELRSGSWGTAVRVHMWL